MEWNIIYFPEFYLYDGPENITFGLDTYDFNIIVPMNGFWRSYPKPYGTRIIENIVHDIKMEETFLNSLAPHHNNGFHVPLLRDICILAESSILRRMFKNSIVRVSGIRDSVLSEEWLKYANNIGEKSEIDPRYLENIVETIHEAKDTFDDKNMILMFSTSRGGEVCATPIYVYEGVHLYPKSICN